jgi:CheY-like chemotaxis protein
MATLVFCESNYGIRRLIQVMMQGSNHTAYMAADGLEGLTLVQRTHPDIVFSDISMPRCDGFQLADALHAYPVLARIPIIFLLSSVERSVLQQGAYHGATGYLLKPFSAEELQEKIEVALLTRNLTAQSKKSKRRKKQEEQPETEPLRILDNSTEQSQRSNA